MLITAFAVVIMMAMTTKVYAADSGITMTYKPIKEIASPTLADLTDPDWAWRPTFNKGDVLTITEKGRKRSTYMTMRSIEASMMYPDSMTMTAMPLMTGSAAKKPYTV